MAQPQDKKEFESWVQALHAELLSPQQLALLQELVDEGKADTLERAALLLDWQESVMDATEHMYGF